MMKSLIHSTAIVLLSLVSIFAVADAQDTTRKTGALTIPWDEFKGLLNLDEDQIVIPMQTFQKLLAQTGITTTPPHTLQGGNVVLTRAEFTNLVNQMKTPILAAGNLPFDYLVTKSIYSGKIHDGGTTFKATFIVHVLKKNTYVKVPLVPYGMALEDVTIDGVQTLVVSDNGYHNVIFSKAGEYEVSVSFSLKSSLKSGPNKIDFTILPTSITLLKLDIPLANIDVEIPQAQKVLTSSTDSVTTVTAALAQNRNVSVRWRRKVAPADKIPPKLYTELHHLVSIEDDALKVSTNINLNILYSEINEIQLSIPAGMNVLSVTGEGIGEWQETLKENEHRILIPFTYGKKGAVVVRVTTEAALTESGLANTFLGMHVLESVRETAFIGIELNTSAEVLIAESDGLEPVAVQKLPSQLINKSSRPLMFGFKNLKHPFRLAMDIKKHQKVAVPMATINSANVVTLFTDDGKVVHRLVYHVRNNAKQFLEIQIPSNADVWSVFVDGKPVESSINSEEKLLVPLIRSRAANNQLGTFPVEIIYCQVKDRFTWLGSRESSLPAVDLLVSQLMWSVYLPNDYAYHHFSSTLEVEEMIQRLSVLATPNRRYNEEAMKEIYELKLKDGDIVVLDMLRDAYEGAAYKSSFRNIPMEEDQIVSQLNAELEFGGRMERLAQDLPRGAISGGTATGVLPIQIRVPTGGQVYRFAKTIIKPEDPLTMDVTYSRSWVPNSLKWILLLLAAFILYLNRRRFLKPLRWIANKPAAVISFYKRHRSAIEKAARSNMAPVVLFGLIVMLWPFSKILSVMCLFLFWVSAVYQLFEYRKKRALAKASATPKE